MLASAIGLAISVAETVGRNEARAHGVYGVDCQLWRRLLEKSRDGLFVDVAPSILAKDLVDGLQVELSERRWKQFLRWFDSCMRTVLAKSAYELALPMLYGARMSDRRGGRAVQARYYISFDPPESVGREAGEQEDRDGSDNQEAPVTRELQLEIAELRSQLDSMEFLVARLKRLLADRDLELDELRGGR